MAKNESMEQKWKTLKKLFAYGCRTEQVLYALPMERMLEIPGVQMNDLKIILEIRKATKEHHLYQYLAGFSAEEESPKEPDNYTTDERDWNNERG